MSQSSLIQLPNESGVLFRQHLNELLSALNTCFSGTTEPSVTEVGMYWLDTSTTPPALKKRNDTNTAWVVEVTPFSYSLLDDIDAETARATLEAASSSHTHGVYVPQDNITGAATLPAGTTAERPQGVAGKVRYNSDLNDFEGYANGSWGSLGGGAIGALSTTFQTSSQITSTATGTSDAITATFTPAITDITNGMTLLVRAASANATTTPTFTPASGTIAAKAIVKGAGAALVAGDIAGAGHWLELQYDSALNKWGLQNPANGVNQVTVKQIQTVTASVSANALTLGLAPTTLDFRSGALTSGAVNTRTISAALSLVVPSGATLGTVNSQSARLVLLAINNAGTVELAVVNLAGGVNIDETTLISTTALSDAADSASVIYSTATRTSVPFRVVGFVDITESTAGTWATAPTRVQGCGGQALAALSSLGYGQTWQNVKASRAFNTTYYNTTSRPILVSVGVNNTEAGGSSNSATLTVNGVIACFAQQYGVNTDYVLSVVGIVPPGASYSVSAATTVGSIALNYWSELR